MGRPITTTVGPLVAASATNIGTSQKAAGAQFLVLNGTTADAVANNICASQTPSGAGNLTLNGSAVVGGIGYVPQAPASNLNSRRITITSAGNDSGVTFTVTGTIFSLTGPIAVMDTVTGANASVVSTTKRFSTVTSVSISGAAAGAVTVGTNGVATLDMARRIIITSGGTDTGITFTFTGTNWSGQPISEVLTGASGGAATSVLDYKTITSIQTSGAVNTTVTVGTNSVAGSPWVRLDHLAANAQVAIQCDVSGTVNATVQQTLDDPNVVTNQLPPTTTLFSPSSVTWINHPTAAVVGFSSAQQANYAYPPVFARVLLNSGSGSVTATFAQAYLG